MYHTTLSSQYTRVAFVICLLLGSVFAIDTNEPEAASQLKARNNVQDIEKALRYDHGFDYKEETWMADHSQPSARVKMSARKPALALESLADRIDRIECTGEEVLLTFATLEILESVYTHFKDIPEFLLITFHGGCNAEGERGIYLVSGVSFNIFLRRIDLAVTPMSWKDACHSVEVNFQVSDGSRRFSQSGELRKRQNVPTTTTASATSVSISIPPSSQPTPAVHQVHQNININFQNTQILPPQFPGVDDVTLKGPFVPHGITFGCKNCTVTGAIDLIQGEFSIAQSNNSTGSSAQKTLERETIVNETEKIVHFFKSGFLEFRLDSFAAHIELDSAVTSSKEIQSFKIPFPQIPLTLFTVPGIATVGPIFSPNLVISTEIAADLNFTYGFDLTVPPSTVIIDIANVTNSSVSGFAGANITPLPFQSQFNNISLTLSASFSPELLLGFSVFNGDGTAGLAAFLNLPTVSATLAQVSHVNAQCEPAPPSTPSDITNATADFFASLTHLTPTVKMGVGVLAEADIQAGTFKFGPDPEVYPIYQTEFPLPTACMSFDPQAKSFSPATAVVASATASAGAKALPGGAKGGAVSGNSNPLGSAVGRWGRIETTAGILGAVFALFLSL